MPVLLVLGVFFFVVTFGPRFFGLMNFSYGFLELGLYSQFFSDLAQGFRNPYIPSLGNTFFALRPEPLLLILWPISYFTSSPTVFLFLDEISVVVAAAVCANFAWRKTDNSPLALAVYFSVLFSPLLMDSLHDGGRIALWAQPFLALLFTEYFSRRRVFWMGLWFGLLCLLNLNFSILGVLLVPLVIFTQAQRWKLRRRTEVALPLLIITILGFGLLHYVDAEFQMTHKYFWMSYRGEVLKWLMCFWFLPLAVPEVLVFSLLILSLNLTGFQNEVALIVVLGVLAPIIFFERIKVPESAPFHILGAALVLSSIFYNAQSSDPLFRFWNSERWTISDENKKVHDMMARIPTLDTLAASDVFTPHLAGRMSLMTVSAVRWGSKEVPQYVLTRNETFTDGRFNQIDANPKTGTRLFQKIK